jgi:hypothetical protein
MHDFEPGMMPWKTPFTLGHENAGWADRGTLDRLLGLHRGGGCVRSGNVSARG